MAFCVWMGTAVAAPVPGLPSELTEQGLRYLHAEGVERDPQRAVVYLCAAARKGHAMAAYELGWLYYRGHQVQRDDGLAAAWLDEARRLGDEPPQRLIEGLAAVERKPLRCVSPDGIDLQSGDQRRADLMVTIYELAPTYDLDPALVVEVVRAESNFNPHARSHKGALGLMQLIPATAQRFGVRDPFEPLQNLHGGMAYLRWLYRRFNGDIGLTLAGYNAGEAAVERHGGIPPYAETREYVRRILQRYDAATPADAVI